MKVADILRLICASAVTAALMATLATAQEPAPWTAWQATLHRDHPLAGKIWSAREKRFIAPQDLAKAVRSARFVLLGEVHDNPDAHRLQAWLVGKAAKDGTPAVVMEMIAQNQAEALKDYLARADADATGLGKALDWEARGWPDWAIYRPIAQAALARGLAIRAGDIDRPTLKKVGSEGFAALAPERRTALLLDTPLGDDLNGALLEELYASHCELVPRQALAPMGHVQRLRDAVLADSLITAAGAGSAVLIAGNGHVRSDRAVPWYLARRAAGARVVTVMMLEVEAEANRPGDLVPTGPDGQPAADYAWFTPRAEREDQCESLRKRFGK